MIKMPESLFPVEKVSQIAERESWRKEINRPIYHIHKWWAQRLGSVFRALLLYLIYPDKDTWEEFYKIQNANHVIVLDPFMGSGTTVGEAIKLGAKAIGCDINPISSFLVRQELTKVPFSLLWQEYYTLQQNVANDIQDYYLTINPDTKNKIPVLYYFWVKYVSTPNGEEIPLFSSYVFAKNAYASKKPEATILCPECWKVFKGTYNASKCSCPHCGYTFDPQNGPAKAATVTDSHGKEYKIKDLIPAKGTLPEKMYAVLAVDEYGKKRYLSVTDFDLELYRKAELQLAKSDVFIPSFNVEPGYNTDQARAYNYLKWSDFFNSRQLLCLGKLLSAIMKIESREVREQFLCLFSSTLEFNNTFCSYKGEGTGAVRPIFSNHILKPERTPLENSIWGQPESSGCFSSLFNSRLIKAKNYLDEPFEIKIDSETGKSTKVVASNVINATLSDSWDELQNNGNALILNGDSANLPIPDESVDFVVTDPPYFDFIHYSELSDFFFAWLAPILKGHYEFFSTNTSRRDNEVQQTDASDFALMLGRVFRESYRVLKPAGKLAFSFHHSKTSGWAAISKAISDSGFYIHEVFPTHAELMASTPKAGAKEPISLDAMIVCDKTETHYAIDSIVSCAIDYISDISEQKQISKTDVFVIAASQALFITINNRHSFQESMKIIDDVYQRVMVEVSFHKVN